MAGIAAAPVAGLPAIAAEADPIFSVIERHRAAEARFSAACRLTDGAAAREEGRFITPGCHAEFEAAEREALDAFLATTPATMAGVRAFFARLHRR